ncbi:MAG: hypothetical protein Kow00106_11260 [Anaerolineae bacterium]
MSQAPTPPELAEAYRLLKAGQRQQAGAVLKPYLEQHRNDARAWWLMAHIVTKPEAVRQCLEKVVLLDPTHEKARARLAALSAPPDDEPDDSFFEIPARPAATARPTVAERPGAIRALGLPRTPEPAWTGEIPTFEEFAAQTSAGIDPFTGEPIDNPFANLDRLGLSPEAAQGTGETSMEGADAPQAPPYDEQGARRVLWLALGALVAFLLIMIVLTVAENQGWLKRSGGRVPAMTTLNGELFTIDYPKGWDARCLHEPFGYPVCGIANHALYNEVEYFAGTPIDLGAMIARSLGTALSGEELPDERFSIIVMDVPPASPAYDDASWAKTKYEWNQGGMVTDSTAQMNYERRQITVDGAPAFYYVFTSQGRLTEAAWDVYVPHGGIVLWLRVDYVGPGKARIPQPIVDAMIESIQLSAGR